MSEKTENYFRIRIRHNNPCWAEKTAYQVIHGQLQPFSAIVHKVHHTYVRTTPCYIQNNFLLLDYVKPIVMKFSISGDTSMRKEAVNSGPFRKPNTKSTEQLFGRVRVLCKTIPIC